MLASKPENYVHDVQILEKANVEWFHIDVLDGTFTDTYAFPVEHLEIIKDYKKLDETTSIWTSEDFTAIDKAVVDGKKVYS